MIIYFSATGNSRFAAHLLADQLNEPITDAGAWIKNNQKGEFYSQTPWIFVAPTYSWQMPHIFADFIRETRFLDNREAYFILTCGGETGNADQEISALCKEKGLNFHGVWPTVMPDNYIIMFPSPAPDKCPQMMEKAADLLKRLPTASVKDRIFLLYRIIGWTNSKAVLSIRAFTGSRLKPRLFIQLSAVPAAGNASVSARSTIFI